MKYDVVTYGVRVLRQKADPIVDVSSEIRRLADDMLETMYAHNGVGLAAEQIGKTQCICVIDIPPSRETEESREQMVLDGRVEWPLVMINPQILERAGRLVRDEGCLSFPGIYAPVLRATEVTVTYLDLKANRQTIRVRDLLARAVQHELDHLGGVLLVDRMSMVKKVTLGNTLKRMRQETEEKFGAEAC